MEMRTNRMVTGPSAIVCPRRASLQSVLQVSLTLTRLVSQTPRYFRYWVPYGWRNGDIVHKLYAAYITTPGH